MALQTQELKRVFKYNNMDLEDPGSQYSAEAVKGIFSAVYPEIVNAAIEGPEEKDGQMIYTFRRAVGTKGVADDARCPPPAPLVRPGVAEITPDETALVIDLNPKATAGVFLIAQERKRQVEVKRWSVRHDDEHTDHGLAMAACGYAAPEPLYTRHDRETEVVFSDCWPSQWAGEYDKRERDDAGVLLTADTMSNERRIRNLAKAGALIAAEIDRLTRLGKKR